MSKPVRLCDGWLHSVRVDSISVVSDTMAEKDHDFEVLPLVNLSEHDLANGAGNEASMTQTASVPNVRQAESGWLHDDYVAAARYARSQEQRAIEQAVEAIEDQVRADPASTPDQVGRQLALLQSAWDAFHEAHVNTLFDDDNDNTLYLATQRLVDDAKELGSSYVDVCVSPEDLKFQVAAARFARGQKQRAIEQAVEAVEDQVHADPASTPDQVGLRLALLQIAWNTFQAAHAHVGTLVSKEELMTDDALYLANQKLVADAEELGFDYMDAIENPHAPPVLALPVRGPRDQAAALAKDQRVICSTVADTLAEVETTLEVWGMFSPADYTVTELKDQAIIINDALSNLDVAGQLGYRILELDPTQRVRQKNFFFSAKRTNVKLAKQLKMGRSALSEAVPGPAGRHFSTFGMGAMQRSLTRVQEEPKMKGDQDFKKTQASQQRPQG